LWRQIAAPCSSYSLRVTNSRSSAPPFAAAAAPRHAAKRPLRRQVRACGRGLTRLRRGRLTARSPRGRRGAGRFGWRVSLRRGASQQPVVKVVEVRAAAASRDAGEDCRRIEAKGGRRSNDAFGDSSLRQAWGGLECRCRATGGGARGGGWYRCRRGGRGARGR
jgi:hypothetical protein